MRSQRRLSAPSPYLSPSAPPPKFGSSHLAVGPVRPGRGLAHLLDQVEQGQRREGLGEVDVSPGRHAALAVALLRLVDSTPLPCAASREAVKRSALAGYAGYGYCRSHHRYFWGFRLYVLAAPDGLPVAWCLATPKLGEREVVAAMLDHERARLRPGLLILGDKGFAGRDFERLVAEHGARLLRPDRADEPRRVGSLGRVRQWVESAFDTLKDQLGLERHGGRTLAGVYVRVAQRLLALASAIWWNWQVGAPDKRSLVAYDH